MGGGLPIGACIAFGSAAELFRPGQHASTFGGNPVACAAALAVLRTIEDDGLLASVKSVGSHLAERLQLLDDPLVLHVRGQGLWQAVALTAPVASEVEAAARARGLLVNAVQPTAIRLAPPLITTWADVDEAVPILAASLRDVTLARQTAGPDTAGRGPTP